MKKILSFIILSVFCLNTLNAEVTWNLSDDGTLTISGTGNMENYVSRSVVPWYSQQKNIKHIVIEDGITSIGNFAFSFCTALTSITISNSVKSIGDYAFLCCSLTAINIPESVISIGCGAFSNCTSLASIAIPNSITNISRDAFYVCSSLASVTIPNSVTSISDSAFEGCSSLTSVAIPNSVTSIGNLAFCCCSSLTSITIPNSVTSIGGGAFMYCPSLTSITIPNSITCISDCVFTDCSGLTSITIPNSVANIGDKTFYGCSSLTSINIPNSVTSIGKYTFENCHSLTSITIPDNVTSIGDQAFCNCNSLISINIPNSVVSIGNQAFAGCSSLISITLPNSVRNIGVRAFQACSSITTITIPNSVTSIGNMAFGECSDLASIEVEDGNTYYDSRNNCNAIIRKSDNELVSGCRNTIIPNSVTSIGNYAFFGCSGLISITIPDCVTSISDYAFSGCCGLTSINIPNSVTNIGWWAFCKCSSLASITIPNSVTNIGVQAFSDCCSLISITIPNSVTSIGEGIFESCLGLKKVTFEVNKDLQLEGCPFGLESNLEEIIMNGKTLPKSVYNDFAYGLYTTTTLYVPSSLYDEYCSTSPWNKFTNIMRIPDGSISLVDGEAFAIEEQCDGQDISYTRTFNNTAWQALYIPFSLNYDDWKDNFEVAYINGVRQLDKDDDGTIDETIMDVIKIKSGSTSPNMPYLIKAKTVGTKNIYVTNTILYAAEENSVDCSTTIAKYTFTGTYNTIPSATMIANEYYAMGGGDLIQSDGSNDLMPYRWYMKVESRNHSYKASNAAKTITINVIGDEEEKTTTGIHQLQITNDELPVYDLNGRKVNGNNLKPGIYVKNGKKVIIK